MKKIFSIKILLLLSFLGFASLVVWMSVPEEEIDFNTQVRPILNKHCISCHGGVKQNGGFSLLFEEEAKSNTNSEWPAIIPGEASNSEMIKRLHSKDPEERMPYEKEPLSKDEISILTQWIDQGAKWGTHWAYLPVAPKETSDEYHGDDTYEKWAKNEIDFFVYDRLVKLKLAPSPQADLLVLMRRLSLDINGLPVMNIEDDKNIKIDDYINQCLNSPHFGEKWAGMWMDLARYSDTKGYERDDARTIWRYRDWLIKAFNDDKPYNQFLIEQIAGDLLPNPTNDQLIATAFHRNTMTNDEGGTDNEEFRVAAVVDRVNTTWEVTMGTSFSCVQCHSHPYDPFKQEDYYKFMAFFNNTRDEDTYDDYPVFRHFESDDSVRFEELTNWLKQHADDNKTKEITRFVRTWQPSYNSLTSDHFVNSELADTKWLVFRNNGSSRLKNVDLTHKNKIIYRYRSFLQGGIWEIHLDSLNGPLLKRLNVKDTKRNWEFDQLTFSEVTGVHDLYFTYHNPKLKNPRSNGLMFDWFYFTDKFPGITEKGYAKAKSDFWSLLKARTPRTPIMLENPASMARETRIFERGNWMDKGALVSANVPAIMNALSDEEDANRLGLAKWMVSEQNPLTARTYVNRIWEQLFGFGIVETLEDFGSQGIAPTHQDLLDHLAWRFMHDFEWSTKKLIKYIVSSATYQQSSVNTKKHLKIDPQNRYYARGPRIRLTAEQVRDQALVVSGLFNPKMYGPSVMPYQPEGIWKSPYSNRKWIQSKGGEQYRRAIYTYWKRTSPYPSMLIFDAMAREVCNSRRISTNTPLQALVTLNDSAYVEASANFAKRMMDHNGSIEDQISFGYEVMMNRSIDQGKLEILVKLFEDLTAEDLIKQAAYQPGSINQKKREKSMIILANTMLNLDEFLMKN